VTGAGIEVVARRNRLFTSICHRYTGNDHWN